MADSDRLEAILGEWRERLDRGEVVDAEDVIAGNPDLADALRERFAALRDAGSLLRGDAVEPHAPPPSMRLRTLSDDRYRDFRPAGEGGMGIVYWAIDSELNRAVAFKVVRPDAATGTSHPTPAAPDRLHPPGRDTPASKAFETLKARFFQEAWVTGSMEHPGVVPVYELGQTAEGVPYYTMRFVRGNRTLATEIDAAGDLDARLRLLEPFLKVCDTLRYAHARGIVHRDLKPENVALGDFGEAIVLDWGLAKIRGEADLGAERWRERVREYREATDLRTVAGALGTPGYMSPEAVAGRVQEVDERSDVYSLGAILYRLLTGRLPFELSTFGDFLQKVLHEDPAPPRARDPAVPEALSDLCVRALARDPAARPAGAAELAEAVRGWQARSAVDREVEALLREAEAALAGARGATGVARLGSLERATAACSRAIALRPDDPRARGMRKDVAALHERALVERERTARRRTLLVLAAAVLVVAAGAALWVARRLDERRQDAERATARTSEALERARALGLVGASAEAEPTDPMLALLLAREAARLDPTTAALSRLHGALGASLERAAFRGHGTPIVAAGLVPDGSRVVTASEDGEVRIWDVSGRELKRLAPAPERPPQPQTLGDVFKQAMGGLPWRPDRAPSPLSPDGERILSVSEGKAHVWDVTGAEVTAIGGEAGQEVTSATWSPHGDLVLGVCRDGVARLWTADGSLHAVIRAEGGEIHHARFAPDGKTVVVLAGRKRLEVWDVEGHRSAVREIQPPILGSWSASADGSRIARVEGFDAVNVWEPATGQDRVVVKTKEASLAWAALSPDGTRLLVTGLDGSVRLWDVDGKELITLASGGPVRVWAGFSASGDRLLAAGEHSVDVWDATGRTIAACRGADTMYATLSADGKRLLTFGGAEARLSDLRPSEDLALDGPALVGRAVQVLPESGRLVIGEPSLGTAARTIIVDARDGRTLTEVRGAGPAMAPQQPLPMARDADVFLTFQEAEVVAWDRDGKERARLRFEKEMPITAAVSPSGDRIAVATMRLALPPSSRLTVFDGSGARIAQADVAGVVSAIHFSPAGDRVLLVSTNFGDLTDAADLDFMKLPSKLLLCGLDGAVVAECVGHQGMVFLAAVSPKGDRILSCSIDGTARLWDLDGREIARFERPGDTGALAAFLDDGRVLAFSGATAGPGTLRIFDRDGRILVERQSAMRTMSTFVVAPRASGFAVAARDGTVGLLDAQGRDAGLLRGTPSPVVSLAFADDGRRLVTLAQDGLLRTWLLDPDALLRRADERVLRDFDEDERQRYAPLLHGGR